MDKQFFDKNEETDFEKFIAFNDKLNMFEGVEKMKKGWHSDATGRTKTKKYNIELKDRGILLLDDGRISGHSQTSGKDFIDNGIMLESHKYADLMLDSILGYEPIYINFMLNAIVIFNLNNLTVRPKKSDMMNIKSKGYEKFEMAKRQFLDIKDAAIYDKNYNLIKRAGEEFK